MLSTKSRTIPSLTGLRFIAALMVFFSHFQTPGIYPSLSLIQQSGYVGVTFFFVLSGFIIAINYLEKFEKNPIQNTYSYLLARFAKIYPLYLFCILFVWISQGAQSDITRYLLATHAWDPSYAIAYGLVSQSWSISVEFFLYLTFPLIIPTLKILKITESKNRLIIFSSIVVILQFGLAHFFVKSGLGALPGTDPDSAQRWLYRAPITRILDFSLGIAAAIYYMRHVKDTRNTELSARLLTYASVICILMLMSSTTFFLTPYSFDAIYALPFAVLILSLAIARNTIISRGLSTPKMIVLGEASFALYLLQSMLANIYIVRPEASLASVSYTHLTLPTILLV